MRRQCEVGLKCFERSGYTPIPGCEGTGTSSYDYCVSPAGHDWILDLGSLVSPPGAGFLMQRCQGNCVNDRYLSGWLLSGLFHHQSNNTLLSSVIVIRGWSASYEMDWQPFQAVMGAASVVTITAICPTLILSTWEERHNIHCPGAKEIVITTRELFFSLRAAVTRTL